MSHRTTLYRLYRTKFTLLAMFSFFAGLSLLFWAHWAIARPGWSWVASVPATEIGSGLLFGGLFGIAFQFVGQADADALAGERFRRVIAEEAPAIRKAVVDAFALEPEELSKVATPETLDKLVENSLALRLGDKDFAADIYTDFKEQVLRSPERSEDTDVDVTLAPWSDGPASGNGSMFVATIRWEYKTTLVTAARRFVCTSDMDEYRDELRSGNDLTWYFASIGQLTGGSKEAFELLDFAVDGRHMPTRRATRAGSQHYTVTIPGDLVGKQVVISFAYRVLVQRHGHLLHIDFGKPTNGLRVNLRHGGCGIRRVNVVDYIAGARLARIAQSPTADPMLGTQVTFEGWVMPKAGIGFVWILEIELSQLSSH